MRRFAVILLCAALSGCGHFVQGYKEVDDPRCAGGCVTLTRDQLQKLAEELYQQGRQRGRAEAKNDT